jgi:hypothetical protein
MAVVTQEPLRIRYHSAMAEIAWRIKRACEIETGLGVLAMGVPRAVADIVYDYHSWRIRRLSNGAYW